MMTIVNTVAWHFLKDFIYLFSTEKEGERKGGGETSMCGCL